MNEQQKKEYEECLKIGEEYIRTGNVGLFCKDSRLEVLKGDG